MLEFMVVLVLSLILTSALVNAVSLCIDAKYLMKMVRINHHMKKGNYRIVIKTHGQLFRDSDFTRNTFGNTWTHPFTEKIPVVRINDQWEVHQTQPPCSDIDMESHSIFMRFPSIYDVDPNVDESVQTLYARRNPVCVSNQMWVDQMLPNYHRRNRERFNEILKPIQDAINL